MAEDLLIDKSLNKEELYTQLLPQLKALVEGEPDEIANMANLVAAIKEAFGFLWVGFYRVVKDELVLGPFQGPLACTRIGFGKGVCGKCWEEGKTLIVDDVDAFPGHIACSSWSRSEIVLAGKNKQGTVTFVLDIDNSELASFDQGLMPNILRKL